MSHVVRTCPVCAQRFVGSRAELRCSPQCDARAAVERSAPASALRPKLEPSHAMSYRPPSQTRSATSIALQQARAAIRASVLRQLAEGRRRAAS